MRQAKYALTCAVASLYLAACLLPGCWGRGGFLEGGTELPGWFIVLGPCYCFLNWPSTAAMILSVRRLWKKQTRLAFLMACINLLPVASLLAVEEQGRFELRIGYYLWLAALAVWALGVGCFVLLDRRKPASSSKPNPIMDEP
ncbi:hypothetical protein Sinac_4530 [Singulisphaera acidiphila DSM 18658]|uniref:Uncharacterized protein n=1 Tax=Singulisphaera acidiphila (strain ATCC BAA-1392 / DSM 18658 / VKM B-2454 / MOB10) TaxID=886293 RepID=L0DHH5_SINAD|nr:hypothetical protein Sinac_4530 [Singulisphaera acidiphila DSM 18658]